MLTISAERTGVLIHRLVEHIVSGSAELGDEREVVDRHHDGRVGDEPETAVDHADHLREGLPGVLPSGASDDVVHPLALVVLEHGLEIRDRGLDVEPPVPDIEGPETCELSDRLPIGAGTAPEHLGDDRLLEAQSAQRHRRRCRQPLDVPLEGSRQGLVEVVDVEDQATLWRGEHAEVRQVGVATELDVDPGRRGHRQVIGHHRRRSPQEGEGADCHAVVTKRHELRDPRPCLVLEGLDRIEVRVTVTERAEALAWQRLAPGLALVLSLDRPPRGDV